jgi:hypothetical protein
MTISLLLPLDGDSAPGDISPSSHTLTLYGGAALSPTQKKFGSTSLYFDGVDDSAVVAGSLGDWSFAANEMFTLDFWVYVPNVTGDKPILSKETTGPFMWWIYLVDDDLRFVVYDGSGYPVNLSAGSFPSGAWTHVAIVRNSAGQVGLYVNGIQAGLEYYPNAFVDDSALSVGWWTGPDTFSNAYLDEIRILKGEAAWTANFTPPTEPYTAAVHTEHNSPFSLGLFVMAEHAGRYGAFVEAEHAGRYGALVEAEHAMPILLLIEAEHATAFSLLALVETEHAGRFDLLPFTLIEAEHAMPFISYVEAEHATAFSLLALVEAEHATRFSSTVDVHAEHAARFTLMAFTVTEAEHAMPYRLGLAESINVTDSAILYHKGRRVEIISARIKQDEGDPFWSGSVELADAADYTAMTVDDPVLLTLGVITYSLIIDGKEKSRSFGQVALSITLLSPGAMLTFPRANPITKTWPPVQARTAAEEAVGAVIDWQIPDWLIPDSRLAMVTAAPLEVARKIVEAAGGILQSKPDGSLLARQAFPVAVPKWPSATPDFILTDDLHNLTAHEAYRHSEIVNQVTIRDTSADSNQDQTEYLADKADNLKGILYVFPKPWRPIAVVHTGHPAVGLAPLGVQYLEKKELVEFKAGKGAVGRAVYSILSVKWQYANLGAVDAAETDLASAIAAYSLAWITYRYRCYAFAVNDTIPETIQFLVMDQ